LNKKQPIQPKNHQYLPSEARFHATSDSIQHTLTKYEFSSQRAKNSNWWVLW
jgi:hypothetical protein